MIILAGRRYRTNVHQVGALDMRQAILTVGDRHYRCRINYSSASQLVEKSNGQMLQGHPNESTYLESIHAPPNERSISFPRWPSSVEVETLLQVPPQSHS